MKTFPSPGDMVQISSKGKHEQGILMPSPDPNVVLIKLSNGYNLGFEKKQIQEIKLLQPASVATVSKSAPRIKSSKALKTISILHCGGTIASKVDYTTGAVKATFSPEEILTMFPELGEIVNIRSRLIANMMSENMRFSHYNLIAKEIEKEVKAGSQGIIVTHGTDTLHYSAAALAFALEHCPIPVLLVGAQRSSDRGSSDAFLNLKCAAQFCAKTNFKGVALCMHASAEDDWCAILPGVRSRKIHSSRRDAFKAINADPIALVNIAGEIQWKQKQSNQEQGKFQLKLFDQKLKIGILKSHPQMFAEEIKGYEKYDGLILEGTGLGHYPIEHYDKYTKEHSKIFNELEKLAKKIPIIMTTQTIFGVVNMNVYSPGRRQTAIGILGNMQDLITETVFIKLAWLLSNYDAKKTKELWDTNLRGELSSQRKYEPEYC